MSIRKDIRKDSTFFNRRALISPVLTAAAQASGIIDRQRQLLTKSITDSNESETNRQPFDSLRIAIARFYDNTQQFQVKLERPGARPRYGSLERYDTVHISALQELRRSYERQLQIMHELAITGAAVPPPDDSLLLTLG